MSDADTQARQYTLHKRSGSGAILPPKHILGLLILLGAMAFNAAVRIHTTLSDPNFDPDSAEGLLRSDPGLLYYITERIIEAGGLPPDDFRADPRIEYPETSDLPAMFTVGQEFVVAWCYLLFGRHLPLHVFCVWVMGIFASLAALGVYGLALELTGKVRWAAGAVVVYCLLPASYRTIGFILIREDFSIPFFALHLYLLARAARVPTIPSFVLLSLALVAAVSTWHAMSFVVTIEVFCMFAWFLRSGQNPLMARNAWIAPAVVVLFSLLIPVLRSKTFVLSLPMQMVFGMLGGALIERRWQHRALTGRVAAVATACILLAASLAISQWGAGGLYDYGHVFALLKAKVLYLGILPAEPSEIPFDARLLWQGPFKTATAEYLIVGLGVGLVLLFVAVGLGYPGWRTGRGDGRVAILTALSGASAVSAYLVRRTIIVPAMLMPVVAAVWLMDIRPVSRRRWLVAGGALVQVVIFGAWLQQHRIAWYLPAERNAETQRMVAWVQQNIPAGEPVAADFLNSTALLARTRHPMVLQPKYETSRSRRRIEEYFVTFVGGTPEQFRQLLNGYACRYVLIDREMMWAGARYIAGVPREQRRPAEGTAAEAFCTESTEMPNDVPGFRLVYRSPPEPGSDLFRLYELD